MRREMSNTVGGNTCVRFVAEGCKDTYPFLLGISGFTGFGVAVITFKSFNESINVGPSNQLINSVRVHEPQANQVEGAAAVFGGPLLSVLAVSVATASILRLRRALNKCGSETAQPVQPTPFAERALDQVKPLITPAELMSPVITPLVQLLPGEPQ